MCSQADDPTQHDVPAVMPMPVDPLIAAVNTPGAHYIDGDGEEWVVGEYGNDYPAEPDPWLVAFFEYEYCAECGGDAQHHTAVPFLGGPFARCNYPPDAEGSYHPVIAAFRTLEGTL